MAGPETRRTAGRWRRGARLDHRLPRGRGEDPDEGPGPGAGAEPGAWGESSEDRRGIIALLRSLSEDLSRLVRQEIRLAKLEAGRTARRVAADGAWITAGAGIIVVGGLCLVLALALGLGALLGSYWLGALVTGAALVGSGALVAWKGIRDLRAGAFAPTATVETLREDAAWARREMDEFGADLKEQG